MLRDKTFRRPSALFCAAVGLILAIYIWHPITHSWWYITDDYRWPRILGADKSITFLEFLSNCNPSDWPLGSKVNRPSYFFTTSAMMYLFGENIVWWNITRIAMMASSLAALGWVFARIVGIVPSLAAIALLAFHSMWFDALPRLQSELFSLLGLSMTAFLAWALVANARGPERPLRRRCLVGALCFFALYATGSKENITVLMAMIAGVTLIATWVSPSHTLAAFRLPAALVLACSATLFCFIYRGVMAEGVDLYGRAVHPTEALHYFWLGILEKPIVWSLTLTSLIAAVASLGSRSPETRSLRVALAWNATLQACILFYTGFLTLFYRGEIPELNCRYQFPYALLPLLALIAAAALILDATKKYKRINLWMLSIISIIAPLVAHRAITHPGSSYSFNIKGAALYCHATTNFHQRLEVLVKQAVQSPSTPILFVSHGLNDFEPLISVDLFLKADGCQNRVFLELNGYAEATAHSQSEAHLWRLINGLYTNNRFHRPEAIPPNVIPIKANFSQADLSNGAVANFWPLF